MKKLITVLCISIISISVWHCKKDSSPTEPSVDTHPDLIVSISPSSTNVDPSEMITLTATVRNTGTEMADPTTLRWYRSTDSTIDTNDTLVGTNALRNLEADGRGTVSISITVPNTVGTNYYGACVDRVMNESNPNNNCSSAVTVVVTVAPNLIVPNMMASSTNVAPSEMITLSATVRNTGDGPSTNTTLRWYLSMDSTIDPTEDMEIETSDLSSLAAGTDSAVSISITVLNTPDTYYYYACVDSVTGETDPNDNCSSTVAVVVAVAPDLMVTNMMASSTNVVPSEMIILEAMVRNTGDGSSTNTTLRWYLSMDSTIDPTGDMEIETSNLSSLAAGTDSTLSIFITVPNTPGTYYYYACVDSVTGESDPNNNCSSAVRVVVTSSDLIVSTLSPSTNIVTPSDTITLSALISNTGDGISSETVLRWYRSTDSTIDTNDTLVGTNALRNLGAGGGGTVSISIMVPNSVGTNYYGVCIDSVTGESDPNNNCSSGMRVIVIPVGGTYFPTSDFTNLSAEGNGDPRGIWSDGTNMWVADNVDNKLYAYDMSTKARNTNEDFTNLSAAGNGDPIGIWSDGTTMWVADWSDAKLYAYDLATKAHVPAKDFSTLSAASNRGPSGIWSDGTTMWVADTSDDKLYAYNMSTKARNTNEDFSTLSAAGNGDPSGIWSDGTTMWVANANFFNAKLYAYKMSDKTHDSVKDFNTLAAAGNTDLKGIWSDGSTMWVSDNYDDKLYAYDARGLVNPNSLSSP